MKLLVTGGAGIVGSVVTHQLVAAQDYVIPFAHDYLSPNQSVILPWEVDHGVA
ncbi:hypothetical protein [Nocardia sp. XZ_19_369]|uniref:hypothetical protein n=1 Tax=Nocardia sp. XZ_19_369 TaxID=2769487 RepID=UPI00188E7FEA|nr:hypothetical protein [Nocardia sp. XZ_19_369]